MNSCPENLLSYAPVAAVSCLIHVLYNLFTLAETVISQIMFPCSGDVPPPHPVSFLIHAMVLWVMECSSLYCFSIYIPSVCFLGPLLYILQELPIKPRQRHSLCLKQNFVSHWCYGWIWNLFKNPLYPNFKTFFPSFSVSLFSRGKFYFHGDAQASEVEPHCYLRC